MWLGLANTEIRGFIMPLRSSVHLQYMSHEISLSLRQSHIRNSESAWHITPFVQKLNYHSKCVPSLRRQKDEKGENGKKEGRETKGGRGTRMKEKERK